MRRKGGWLRQLDLTKRSQQRLVEPKAMEEEGISDSRFIFGKDSFIPGRLPLSRGKTWHLLGDRAKVKPLVAVPQDDLHDMARLGGVNRVDAHNFKGWRHLHHIVLRGTC